MNYLIDVPPPTISGSLHLGHLFSYSHMDVVARNALRQKKTLVYPFCFDCNGLPTEKLASKAGVHEPKDIYDHARYVAVKYQTLFADMNMSFADGEYGRYDTMAPPTQAMARLSFKDLVEKGYAYRAESEYLYCPVLKTSVSQSEVDDNGIYERSGAKVEKRIGDGWFIKIKENLPRIRAAIDEIKWHPDAFRHRLHRWLDDIQYDWSISRTRNYGIHIPGDENEGLVFDTWFTSSLTPQLAWMVHSGEINLKCPIFDCRFQAHDIIRTWALFTIVKSLYHNDQIPWRNIIVSGHALSPKGDKLAKSLGNASDPYEYINKYGSDGVRYWACHTQNGTDTRIDLDTMNYGKKLCNKLRNAKRFLDMQATNGFEPPATSSDMKVTRTKSWTYAKERIDDFLNEFAWADALKELTALFWNEFCDKWIEDAKHGSDCVGTLKAIFADMLPYFGIFMPKIGEELK
jgi:valyl-tRNA synthetase